MTEYQRGYSKGYATGCRRSDAVLAEERTRADLAAERAERAESATSIGHCEECRHWQRGGGDLPWAHTAAWGVCRAPRAAGNPWGCWASGNEGRGGEFQTTPRFGCVLFVPIVPDGESSGEEASRG